MYKQIIAVITVCMALAAPAAAETVYPPDLAARTSILVLPFEYSGVGQARAAMADDYLMEAFARISRFTMVERDKLDRLLLEQKLSREKLTVPGQSLALGRLLSADEILYGRIEESGEETVVTMRMVATATSATRHYSSAATAAGGREFRRLINDIAARVAEDFPLLEGRITGTAGDLYKADFARTGLRSGLDVIVYRWGDEVRHPATGRQLGRRAVRIASGAVIAVEGTTSSIRLSRVEKGRKVKAGDLVITR